MAERADYRHFSEITTRWADNDAYGHVNNAQYYSYFDTAISGYLLGSGLDFKAGPQMGLCAESHCRYLSELSFPDRIDAGLRVEHLGRTSVRYGIGLFRAGEAAAAAEGWFVHVFVDRASRRPAAFTPELRAALEQILVETPA